MCVSVCQMVYYLYLFRFLADIFVSIILRMRLKRTMSTQVDQRCAELPVQNNSCTSTMLTVAWRIETQYTAT